MSRMNNTSRSLQIISKANGWDPTEIIGDAYYCNENRVQVGDSMTIPGAMFDPNQNERGLSMPGPDTRGRDTNRTNGADPKPGGGVS